MKRGIGADEYARPLEARSLLEFASRPDAQLPQARIHHALSMAPARVTVPPLKLGAGFFETWPYRGRPARVDPHETSYDAMAPATFVLRDVIVHASAGIIRIGNDVLAESLWHTSPDEHGYGVEDGKILLQERTPVQLKGTCISILAGAKTNYFHSMIEGAARLAILPDPMIDQASCVLLTAGAVAQDFVIDRLSLPEHLHRRVVTDSQSFRIDSLIYPWSIHGDCDFHPCIADFYGRIAAGIPEGHGLPRRIYIDRRGTDLRPLLNEDAVIAKLQPLGFVPIKPERIGLPDQVRLFRGAEAIVAPHGAGLTNIGYCRPGAILLELFMDAYVNWCLRRLAAVKTLRYDCLLGRSVDSWSGDPHTLRWQISPDHVAGAMAYMLGKPGSSRELQQ
jgi:capsular polysaccharide biosynthesis protein